jgi:hypothetical protein
LNPVDWLCTKEPGFAALPQKERDAIMHFALLWSLFELKVLKPGARTKDIVDVFKKWKCEDQLKLELFSNSLAYFQQRYINDDGFTQQFADLNLRNKDKKLVKSVLMSETTDIKHIVSALFIIVSTSQSFISWAKVDVRLGGGV